MTDTIDVITVLERDNILLLRTQWPENLWPSEGDEIDALRPVVSAHSYDLNGWRDASGASRGSVTDSTGGQRWVFSRYWRFRSKTPPAAS